MKKLFLFILLPFIIYSQNKDINYLVIKGRAEVKVPVDYLEVAISITTYGPTFSIANDSSRALVFRVFNVFKNFSIPDSDFQTANNSSMMQDYQRESERRCVIVYSGILNFRNPGAYDSLLQALVSLGNISVTINQFRNNNRAQYRMLAYQKAVESAREEAKLLLNGTGQSVGKIIKLIQDNRDVFTQYDDIDNLIGGRESSNDRLPSRNVMTSSASTVRASTFRKKDFSEFAEVTVIFAVK